MSQFSRVNKNKELYQDIIQDDDTEIIESSLRDYERRMSKHNQNTDDYVASRLKRNEQLVDHLDVEQPVQLEAAAKEEILSDRDLLSDFIEEVKHYNINKGLRSVQDTQTNILNNLSQGNTSSDAPESQSILELTSEIQQIIGDLDTMTVEEDETKEIETPVLKTLDSDEDEELASIFNEIETSSLSLEEILRSDHVELSTDESLIEERVKPEVVEIEEVEKHSDVKQSFKQDVSEDKADFKANELLELTQTLSLKLDLQEKELEDVQAHSTVIDKILTAIIVILIVAMAIIIIYGVWWVYSERGY